MNDINLRLLLSLGTGHDPWIEVDRATQDAEAGDEGLTYSVPDWDAPVILGGWRTIDTGVV